MSDDLRFALLLASKPLIYGWLFAIPRLWIPKEQRPTRWRPVWAGLLRFASGWLVGLPTAIFTLHLGDGAILLLGAVRFALWVGVTRLCFSPVSWKRTLLFALGATGLNLIFDYTFFEGSWTKISIC